MEHCATLVLVHSFFSDRLCLHFNDVNENGTIEAARNDIGIVHFDIVPEFTIRIHFYEFGTEQCAQIHIDIRCVSLVPSDSIVSGAEVAECDNGIGPFEITGQRTSVQHIWWHMESVE